MFGRPRHRRRHPVRWLGAAAGLAGAGVLAAALVPSAQAAPVPKPNYHPGTDHATFTATGVLDANCLVSTGGTEVWIKPGDGIDFDSAAAGIDLASLPVNTGQVVGLNVSAVIDKTKTSFKVAAGTPTPIAADKLSAGDHSLSWHLDSIAVLPVLRTVPILGPVLGTLTTVPLASKYLKSGASLTWDGVIHVTDSAPQCKLAVGTPKTEISVGPVHATLPAVNVGAPEPKLPGLPGTSKSTPPGGQHSSSDPGVNYTPPGLTIPDEVVPKGYGAGSAPGAGSDPASGSGGGGALQYGGNLIALAGHQSTPGQAPTGRSAAPGQDLATAPVHGPRVPPVALAIAAVVAFSLVTAGAARRYLLHR